MSVDLVIQHAKHMHHIILLPVAWSSLPYFFTLLHKWHETVTQHETCVLIFSANLSTTFMILITIQWDIVISVYSSSCNVDVILVRLQWNIIFYTDFSQKHIYQISLKSVQLELNFPRGWTWRNRSCFSQSRECV